MTRLMKLISTEKTLHPESINAIDFLKEQHREVEKLFREFDEASDRAFKRRQRIFEEISHKLSCHARIEEKIFYPEGKPVDKDFTLESYEEHDVMKSLLRKISHTEPSDESFKAKMTVLKEVVEHHVKEEENEFFPRMTKELGEDRLLALGSEMKKEFEKLDSKHPEPKIRHTKQANAR